MTLLNITPWATPGVQVRQRRWETVNSDGRLFETIMAVILARNFIRSPFFKLLPVIAQSWILIRYSFFIASRWVHKFSTSHLKYDVDEHSILPSTRWFDQVKSNAHSLSITFYSNITRFVSRTKSFHSLFSEYSDYFLFNFRSNDMAMEQSASQLSGGLSRMVLCC